MSSHPQIPGAGATPTTTTLPPRGTDPNAPGTLTPQWSADDLNVNITPTSSPWAANLNSVHDLLDTYYFNPSTMTYESLHRRLVLWRQQYAQTGAADLSEVLDVKLAWSRSGPSLPGPTIRRGDGSSPLQQERRALSEYKAGGGRTLTVAAWLDNARTRSPEKMKELQAQLFEAGYYSTTLYKNPELLRDGFYDAFTQAAFTELLADAVMDGDTPLEELLKNRKKDIDEAGGLKAWLGMQEPERAPFSAVVSHPDDIITTGQTTSVDLTGRRIDEFAEGLVGPLQSQQVSAQRAAYDNEETGGTSTADPSMAGFAEQELRRQHGDEVGAYTFLQNFNVLLQRLGLAG